MPRPSKKRADYSPKLREAMARIKAILAEEDIAYYDIVLHEETRDERLRLRWGVKADETLIGAFVLKARAEQFAALGRRDTRPARRIEVVPLP